MIIKGFIRGHRKRDQTLLNTKTCRSSIIGVCYGWYYLWQKLDAHISKINKVLVNGLLIDWTEQLSTDGLPRGLMNCNVHVPADSTMYFQWIWLQFKSKYHCKPFESQSKYLRNYTGMFTFLTKHQNKNLIYRYKYLKPFMRYK